jgi:hypothetical protein
MCEMTYAQVRPKAARRDWPLHGKQFWCSHTSVILVLWKTGLYTSLHQVHIAGENREDRNRFV